LGVVVDRIYLLQCQLVHGAATLGSGLRFDWGDSQSSICRVTIDGGPAALPLPLVRPSDNGISYVHFQALGEAEDQQGFLIESVEGGR